MSFNTKYRCTDFGDFVGYKVITELLEKELQKKVHKHSYLFYGNYGTGKTSLARILAQKVGATRYSTEEINVGDSTGVDSIREIIASLEYASMTGTKVFILDEAHALTTQAQKALLKPLEEPPEHVYFILCTTEPQKLEKGLRDRCFQLGLPGFVSVEEQKLLIDKISTSEGYPRISPEVEKLIRVKSEGIPRVILNLLEGVLSLESQEEQKIYVESCHQGMAVHIDAIELCRALAKQNWEAVAAILLALQQQKQDPEGLRRLILSYFSKSLLTRRGNTLAFQILNNFKDSFFYSGFPGLVAQCYKSCS